MSRRGVRGFSLVEMMVALGLSLVITAGVAKIWASNKQTFRSQDNRARLQENGRFALAVLERELRLSGYKGLDSEGADPSLMFGTSNPALSGTNDTTSVVVGNGVSLYSDKLTVSFYGAADNSVTNCFGIAVPAGTQASDSFSVQIDSSSGLPSLTCTSVLTGSSSSTTVATLAYSVEALQVLYGEETDGLGTGTPNQFVHAGVVGNFTNVTQVRISLLVRGEDRTVTTASAADTTLRKLSTLAPFGATYYHFGYFYTSNDSTGDSGSASNVSQVADGRQRALFGTTVALRNRVS